MLADQLIHTYPIISDQIEEKELRVILSQLEYTLGRDVTGAVVEFGCYSGTTSLFLQRILQRLGRRPFHVYDSFAGLPAKHHLDQSPAGMQFTAGELSASKAEFIRHFKKANLPLPSIHKGWFDQLTPKDIPNPIAFAFLDGDYYDSIKTSLRLIEHNLSKGAVIIVDDYMNEALPGAKKAVDEWLQHHLFHHQTVASLSVIVTG